MNTKHHTIPETSKFWFSLDNAAKIFPAIITSEVTTVFRLTAVMKNPVNISALNRAVIMAEKRYPYYKVQLKRGFFWYYLEHLPRHIPLQVDDRFLCRKFGKGELLIRILVKNNRISIEYSHILTDGSGAFEFLKTVLAFYAQILQGENPDEDDIENPVEAIAKEEYEDAYKRYFKQDIPPMVRRRKAFHLPYSVNPYPRFKRQVAILSLKQVKQLADDQGVSITVYLVSVYLFVLQSIHENLPSLSKYKKHKILRVQVPVNLRKVYPSKTMRNFSLFVMPGLDLRLGHYTFEEVIKMVYHQVHLETDEKLINKTLSRNVGSEKKIYVRSIPLFLKSMILRMKHKSLGASQYSGVITNLGKAKLPADTEGMTDYFIFTPPPPDDMLKINCGVIGFGNKLVMSFGNITDSGQFEKEFIRFLRTRNIQIQMEEN